jgi:APA family basic amino acid/polyamine antiporter
MAARDARAHRFTRMDAERSGSLAGRGAAPVPVLATLDAVALVLGIVIGAGIFRAPPAVAASAGSEAATIAAWVIGGVVSLAGAMCYAELAATYPSAGGDYHFLSRALGRSVAFLFAWARLTVIPTGSLALLAFVFGDYTSRAAGVPDAGSGLAAAMVVGVTVLNLAGLKPARRAQNALTVALVLGLVALVVTGFLLPPAPAAAAPAPRPALGLAMVFVLLTYGGWNEAAYVSAELRGGRRSIAAALAISLGAVTALYVLVNLAYLRGLGFEAVAHSGAVASDLLSRALGAWGGRAFAVLVVAAVLTSANGTLFMGSRQVWAFGRDVPLFAALGRWDGRAGAPANAILVQGAIALALVGFGAASRSGFEAMVAYTAPVFWLFFLLTGISLFVLRRRDPSAPRPFKVPLYPLTPVLFCAACAFLLWSSVAHAGPGAIVGLAVLATGLFPLWLSSRRAPLRRAAVL